MDDQERRDSAIARLKEKRDFWTHVITYIAVNAFLIGIWAWTTGGYFWPFWPLAGWGIGLAIHAWETYRAPISEAAIQREMEKDSDL
jgi:hypothetical protein